MAFQANDKYRATLRTTFVDGVDTTLNVDAIPANLPTIITVGWDTEFETVFEVTGTSGTNSSNYALTGITKVKGYSGNLAENLAVNCLNHEEYFNQYSTVITGDILEGVAVGSAVNKVKVTNAATGDNPLIEATGTDGEIPLHLKGKSASVLATGIFDNGNSGTSKEIDWKNGDVQKVTLTGNCTFTYANAIAGQRLTLLLIEDATGGRTITLPASKYPSGNAPTYTTTTNAKNAIVVIYDGTDYLTQAAVGFA